MNDALQEIILDVARFRYEPARSNGATETTALTAVIDRQLWKLRRSASRYKAHLNRIIVDPEQSYSVCAEHLALDVRQALATLPPVQRRVCEALMRGRSRHEIATLFGWGWHTVDRLIGCIRERFQELGLDGWIGG